MKTPSINFYTSVLLHLSSSFLQSYCTIYCQRGHVDTNSKVLFYDYYLMGSRFLSSIYLEKKKSY